MNTKDLENEGKQNILQALKNIGIEDEFLNDIDVENKCNECELRRLIINIKTQNIESYCNNDCDEELGNNAEPIINYPDSEGDR